MTWKRFFLPVASTLAFACACRAGEMPVSEIEREIDEAVAECARRQAGLSDRVALTDYSALCEGRGGTNVWTRALQKALDEHEVVCIPASDDAYYIDATLIVPSNRRIEASGATVRLVDGMTTILLRNAHTPDGTLSPIPPGGRDDNIAIVGGRWEDNCAARAGYGRTGAYDAGPRAVGSHYGVSALFYFGNLNHLTVRDATFFHCGGFAVQAGDVDSAAFERIRFDRCFADGIHLNGNVSRVLARDVRGHVGDDIVALNAYDWLNSSVNFGPQRLIRCEDLTLEELPGFRTCPSIRIQPAKYRYSDGSVVDCSISDVVFRRVKGVFSYKMYLQTPAYKVGGKREWAEVGSGGNLHFENLEIDLKRPIDMIGGYKTSDPLRGHFAAFEFGANLSSLYFKDVDVTFHLDKWPLSHLVTVGPKSCRDWGPPDDPLEIFDPYVSCEVGKVVLENVRVRGDAPSELVHATAFDDVNRDGASSGRGIIRKIVEIAAPPGGVWISGDTGAPEKPAPVLVKRFELAEVPQKAILTLAVAGWCEVSVNGRRVGDEVLSPATCQPNLRISSVAYDVAPCLRKGENRVEVLLGNGWYNCFTKEVWGFSAAPWLDAPMIRGEFAADGKVVFATDGSWRAYDSPIVFNALRNGEWYDARMEGRRENERAATVVKYTPYAEVSPADAAPCRVFDPIAPARTLPALDGGTIYDFGSNRAGWCEIEVAGDAGAKVTIDYDECITPTNTLLGDVCCFIRRANDPRPAQHDEYTLAGRPGGERWHPRFTYHGFRYAQVRTEGRVKLKSIKSVFVHSDFKSAGSFEIADPVFAKLLDATRRSYLSNFVGIPTDCPHREKNGWTGDAQLAMETGLWNFDAKAGYVHYLRMMLDAQRPDGAVPCILPCTDKFGYKWGTGPAWDAALFEIPWQLYRFYGDVAPAREAYGAMKKYLFYIGSKARGDGLVAFGLGDWCAPKELKTAPLLLTDSAYVYEFNRRVAFWAERFGENDIAEKCRAEAKRIKASFNKEFYKGNGVYAGGELTSLAAPLYFKGLCKDGEERNVAAELVRRVREGRHRAFFGIHGAKWVPRVLSEYGYIDDAWRIFTQPDAPGWAMWMKDNDTLLESFDDTAGGTPVSHNHIMFGDLSAWAFEYLAGIKIDEPGFAKWHAEPYLPDGVDKFDISHRTPCGHTVRVRAWREDGTSISEYHNE